MQFSLTREQVDIQRAAREFAVNVELIEELVQKGGGYGLLAGCAAGDSGASLVI